jgi:hypothetical protein
VVAGLGLLVAACAAPAAPGATAASGDIAGVALSRVANGTSLNWAGYAATGQRFTSVSASWVQPAVTCTLKPGYSSFWVGLDGDGSGSVEQTGTEADCYAGKATYYGWWEMYPQPEVRYTNRVASGDHMTASVTTDGGGHFTLTISDSTAGWSQVQNRSLAGATLASAEVIAEAPSSGRILPLANFGVVNFKSATVDAQAIGSFNPDPIEMVSARAVKAVPGPISAGTDFAVTWNHR